jgi:hypothetical protein
MKNFNQYITEKIKLSSDRFNKKINLEYVDLELPSGTLWAKCNLGASEEYEYGDYFAWGETEPKKEYTWDTYKFGKPNKLTKYNDKDKLDNIKLTDDPTHVNMGSGWSIPTKKQFVELVNNTKHEVVENYNNSGIDGMLCTAKNGNTLFLPCGGCIKNTSNDAITIDGLYWMSNIDPNDPNNAYYLYFWDTSLYTVVANRYFGLSIRGVLNK